jgi:predicted transcriptional regulator
VQLELVKILEEAGLPKGWAQAVVCDRKGGELLSNYLLKLTS